MDLIIVESPTKAKTLSRFLGSDYKIEASMGHVRDLPESKLGIDVEKDFEPTYVVSEKKQERVKELQSLAAKAKNIILATDPDREGEAISWHIATLLSGNSKSKSGQSPVASQLLSSKKVNVQRITFHEITESAIKEALSKPGVIDMKLVNAQQARRILDRLVGYKLSPILWRKVRKGLSAGRVQSVAVRLIVEREREIKAFLPVEYWEVVAQLQKATDYGLQTTANTFEARLVKIGEEKAEVKNKEQADKIVAELGQAQYKVLDVVKKEVRRNPYPPFTTSTLQQAASNLMGWSAKRTMQIAQNLYEQGLITYHRTDSTNLAIEAVNASRDYIKSEFGEKYLPEAPRLFKTKSKVAQEAHEAIRPTSVYSLPSSATQLDRDQSRLYDLVWKRFLACQMNEAVFEQTSIDIQGSSPPAGGSDVQTRYLLRVTGNRQVFDGWQKLYPKREVVDEESSEKEENNNLPDLSIGDHLNLLKLLPLQHFTQPPPRFTEASLIKALEEFGIGRPSTYAPIISTVQERQYVEKVEKKLQPTALGFAVNDFLMANFPKVFDYQFTAGMEDELDRIANGEKEWVPVLHEFYDPFAVLLKNVGDNAERVKVEVEETDEICPLDGGKVVVRVGRFGKFLACANFPNCKFTKPFAKKIDMKCPKCGTGEIIMKRTKSKKNFFGCSRYPDCDFASWTKPKQTNSNELGTNANESNSLGSNASESV